jgi:trehalose/maltose hydrolase-like predicted phosphorylase
MARENLQYAYETALWMKENASEQYSDLINKIGLEETEPEYWKKAADKMYIPYSEELEIYLQDDGFLDRKKWDFENTPKDKYPILMHYHPLVIYRHQVCKQADTVLGLFLLGDRFTKEEKRKNYDLYEGITTHDSSLSTCIFSIMASEIGYYDKAYQYFMGTARMDIDNYHGNTKDGIHVANMAGTWMCIVNGFAGMRVYDGVLNFNPYLPENWEEYSFKVAFNGRLISVRVSRDGADYTLLEGERLTIVNSGTVLELNGK